VKKKKILFVEQNQDGTIGGSYHSLYFLIGSVNRDKYELIVMFYDKHELYDIFKKKCECHVYEKPLGKPPKHQKGVLKPLFIIINRVKNFTTTSIIPFIKFCVFIHKEKIDLVHLNNTAHAGWEWLVASKICGIKCLSHQRGAVKLNLLGRLMANQFDTIICISEYIDKNLKANGVSKRNIVILNAIDIKEFKNKLVKTGKQIRKEFDIGVDNNLIGMVGNFQEWKGQLTVINAVNILKDQYPGIKCLLIGGVSDKYKKDKEYFEKVKSKILELGLKENIIITGYRPDVPDLMHAFDLIIHSSIQPEPFGRVIIEGMCLEKAVIATDIGGAKEIIENGISGILIPPNRPDILKNKIEYLLKNKEIRKALGKNGFKKVTEKFSIEAFSININKCYKEVIG